MIPVRFAPVGLPKDKPGDLVEIRPRPHESNSQWLGRSGFPEGLLLIGGTSVAHFRIRVAQAHIRSDFLPSYWSLVGLLPRGSKRFFSAPLDFRGDVSWVPGSNGIRECDLREYDDPELFPNIAILRFSTSLDAALANLADPSSIRLQRSVVDIPKLMVSWLAFAWGVGGDNPLLAGLGVPSAVLAETLFSMVKLDLTPGLASSSACPEIIWQTAKFWGSFYRDTAKEGAPAQPPSGRYALRQVSAAVVEGKKRPAGRRR